MPALSLTLLGRPQILMHGQPIELKSQKAQALFFHLIMTGHVHSRQGLAGLLWSDMQEAAARRNLRVELLKLRGELDRFLKVSRNTIALNQQSDYTLDVTRFEACLRGHEPTFAELQEAIALYRGNFLEDFHVRDASLFEEWVTTERERLWQMARQAMLRLVEHYIQRQAYAEGLDCVTTLLREEPWLEEAHQQNMRLLAFSGQRSAALAHYEHASEILAAEFGVPPSDETNELYDQIESGVLGPVGSPLLPAATPTAGMATAPPFQAPTAPLHFVGRHHDSELLQQQLTQPSRGSSVVALVGMAGMGKTTLAAHVAQQLRTHFTDGVLWAYVASSDPLDILGSWAQALGYDFGGLADVEARAAALRGVIAERRLLLILDDVRSLSRVRPLLVGGATSATLLTTRDLDVATALNAAVHHLTEMSADDGEQLLMRVLGENRVQAELDAARQICTLLQNLPLAVEITAQRLRSRPRRRLQDMAERLRDIQERLALAISDRAVRTSFMVSWESLDHEQQRIFALLGVWAGRSFAVPALAALAGLDLYLTEDRLFALTTLSLLNEEEEGGGTTVRYRQHPLLADFAREQLGTARDDYLCMIHYYLAFAQEQQHQYPAIQPEWNNLMAAIRQAFEWQEWQVVIDFTAALAEPWLARARYAEARRAYGWARVAATELGNEHALVDCLLRWGQVCIEQYDYDEAEQLITAALEVTQTLQLSNETAHANYHLARIALDRADYEQAERWLAESQQLFQQLQNQEGLSVVYSQQALLAYRRGYLKVGKALCNQILELDHAADLLTGRLPALRLLADIALEEQDYPVAEAFCNQALALCEELHNRSELASVYYSLTVVIRCQQKLELAQELARRAIDYCDVTGNRGVKALSLHELSRIYLLTDQHAKAIAASEEGMNLLLAIPDNFNLVYILRQLGEAYLAAGQESNAQKAWAAALKLAETQQHPLTEQLRMKVADWRSG